MARLEQKYLVDKEALEHIVALLRDSLAKGANEREIWEQIWEILDPEYRAKTDQAFREMKAGRVRRFKNAEEMIKDLKSRWETLAWSPAYTPTFKRDYKNLSSDNQQRVNEAIRSILDSEDPKTLGRLKFGKWQGAYGYDIGRSIRGLYSVEPRQRIVTFLRCGQHSIY